MFKEKITHAAKRIQEREIGTYYGLNAFPYWVFLDKDLNVVARRTGNLPADMVGALLIQLANQ